MCLFCLSMCTHNVASFFSHYGYKILRRNNYKKLYETKKDYDVKIYAGEKPNIKEFHVHSFVLKTQSEFFNKVFTTKDGIEKKDGYFIINSSNSPKVFEILLR